MVRFKATRDLSPTILNNLKILINQADNDIIERPVTRLTSLE